MTVFCVFLGQCSVRDLGLGLCVSICGNLYAPEIPRIEKGGGLPVLHRKGGDLFQGIPVIKRACILKKKINGALGADSLIQLPT